MAGSGVGRSAIEVAEPIGAVRIIASADSPRLAEAASVWAHPVPVYSSPRAPTMPSMFSLPPAMANAIAPCVLAPAPQPNNSRCSLAAAAGDQAQS